MLADEMLRAGRIDEALVALQDEVRKAPNNVKYRIFLFQLLVVLGRWERALTQLKVVGDLDAESQPMVQTYRELLRCEVLRGQVFSGQKTPVVFGEPQQWEAFVLEALRLQAQGNLEEAKALRDKAFELAPCSAGICDGKPFQWLADGDVRLGPILEVIVNGRYSWLPFDRIRSIRIEPPADLRDLVWLPVTLTLTTGGETVAFVPTRYPGSEASADNAIRLARKTEWTDISGCYVGLGQRAWMTDDAEYAVLDVRAIDFSVKEASDRFPSEPLESTHG